VYVRPSLLISIRPPISVRMTDRSATPASVASVSGAGCPYSLSMPDEMIATSGAAAARKPGVVDDAEPW
jgi:hypothetical protein